MYGIQTEFTKVEKYLMFENDVKMYGIQTLAEISKMLMKFENDVKMYGIQTLQIRHHQKHSLRMM